VAHAEFSLFFSEYPDRLIAAYRASAAKLLFDETVVAPSGLSMRVALLEFDGSLIEVDHPGSYEGPPDDVDV
jgi:hypothetical protein